MKFYITLFGLLLCSLSSVYAKDFKIENDVVVFDFEEYMGEGHRTKPQFYADAIYFLVALQGIVNREAPNLFIIAAYNMFEAQLENVHGDEYSDKPLTQLDTLWLSYFEKKGYINDSMLVKTISFKEVINTFKDKINGLVTWDPGVPASVNLAQMAAGAESLMPLRYSTDTASFYHWIKTNWPDMQEGLNLVGKFTGTGTITLADVSIPSSGSAKNDCYRWALKKYLEADKLDPFYLWYNVDARDWKTHTGFYLGNVIPGFGNYKSDYQHLGLYNGDYWIAKKAFILDLSPWRDEIPSDDPGQPLGTDRHTWDMVLAGSYFKRQGEFGVGAGFITWWLKYTNLGTLGGKHGPVDGEWEFVRILTSYNMANDADAAFGISNSSFYMHLPKFTGEQSKVTYPPIIEHKAGTTYIGLFMLDYDGSAWLNQLPTSTYLDQKRGDLFFNWSINPILHDRVPHVLGFLYENRSYNDIFGISEEGAGYIQPEFLVSNRKGTIQESGIPYYEKFAKKYYEAYNIKYTAFYISQDFSGPWMDMAARLNPLGFGKLDNPNFIHNGTPTANLASHGFGSIPQFKTDIMKIYKAAQNGPTAFHAFRLVIVQPSLLVNAIEEARKAYPTANVKIVDAANYFRLMKGGDHGKVGCMDTVYQDYDAAALIHDENLCKIPRIEKKPNLLKNANFWKCNLSNWGFITGEPAGGGVTNVVIPKSPEKASDEFCYLATNCNGNTCTDNQSVYQDVNVSTVNLESVEFGGKIRVEGNTGTGKLALLELSDSGIVKAHTLVVEVDTKYKTFSKRVDLDPKTKTLRFQFYLHSGNYNTYRLDEMYIKPADKVVGKMRRAVNTHNTFGMYLDPGESKLFLTGLVEGQVVNIYNIRGNKVFSSNETVLDISHLSKGTYIANISSSNFLPKMFVKF
ncbi:MAG: hypothetical protein HQK83_10830 [Fibrobacteria bacterium]|nr:hypothetical protein [Fibrobacteria bacterium]